MTTTTTSKKLHLATNREIEIELLTRRIAQGEAGIARMKTEIANTQKWQKGRRSALAVILKKQKAEQEKKGVK